ncbi:DUF4302 domain-containing protein [Pontibacter sp. E15-1]|uniref:DUF4302 domain-containing protein n=1 Tax=Pontibacter sp. E15-1 TaxID=2919918 RepID=UPI001F4F28B3|nr:DUF4302 domain-containing protein [Pontibacter sp. E15-1]MCJ8166638.1 DUF4302 domain-containing protein [Pontibacter sp. E15-1]
MKKLLYISWVMVLLLAACSKDKNDPAPGERPDERLSATLDAYKAQLVGAENGWKAVLYPEGGAGYSFLLNFTADDRVRMLSDIDAGTAETSLVSTYRLKALQKPALLFDTYSYLHILADPDETKSGGVRGEGKFSDFEFSFDSVTPDSITLIGTQKGSKLVLVRASAADAANYIPRIAEHVSALENINAFTTYFRRLDLGGRSYDISIRTDIRFITFSYMEGGVMQTFTTSYYFSEDGLVLLEPFTDAGFTITALNALQYDAANREIDLQVNGAAATIRGTTRPASIDPQAARNFYNNPPNGVYWLTLGFTVEGVEDALRLRDLPDFQLLVYWPRYGTSNGTTYDLMGFVFGNSIMYGPAAVPSFTSDGRIVYRLLGTLGEIPEDHAPKVEAFTQQWTIPEGYFVIQTGADSYDLVSAKDAKTWISF